MYVSKGIINCFIMWFSSLSVGGGLSISIVVTFTSIQNSFVVFSLTVGLYSQSKTLLLILVAYRLLMGMVHVLPPFHIHK